MGRKIVRIIIAVVFAAVGAGLAGLLLESQLFDSAAPEVMVWMPTLIYIASAIIFGVIGFFLAPLLIAGYKTAVSYLMRRFSDIPLPKIFVGVIGLAIALFIAYLLSFLPLRIQPPALGTSLCILMYLLFGTIGWLIPTRRIKELTLPNWLRSSEKSAKISAMPKVLDTSAIIDGRFFDVYNTGIVEGVVIIPQFVLDELRLIADSSDPIKRTRGRRGLELLNRIRETDQTQGITVSDKDYPDLTDVDAKLIRFASEKHAVLVTNDYNLNKASSAANIRVFNINDLANALRTNVTAGEEYCVMIMKAGKEADQGVAYFDDGTMIVVEGARELVGSSVQITVTSVLQTSAGKMVFAKLKDR